jgi:D-sedoheptulose 7-phosphate isomerase
MHQNKYFEEVSRLLSNKIPNLDAVIESLHNCILSKGSIWIIGNGGSASTADHFEVDLSYVRMTSETLEIRAKSLCSNTAVLTAIGNDIGFENVFAHQLMRQALPGDVCVAISASGNSTNLIRAIEVCKGKSVTSIAILGFDGGKLKSEADITCLIETKPGMYGHVEDVHLSVCHFLAATLKNKMFGGL